MIRLIWSRYDRLAMDEKDHVVSAVNCSFKEKTSKVLQPVSVVGATIFRAAYTVRRDKVEALVLGGARSTTNLRKLLDLSNGWLFNDLVARTL